MVKCPICGREYKQLQTPHIRSHGYNSKSEFLEDYPEFDFTSDDLHSVMSTKAKKRCSDPTYLDLKSRIFKNMWKDPEFRKRKSKQQSELAKKQWREDQSFRDKVTESSRERMRIDSKERWQDPEFRQKMANRDHSNPTGRIEYMSKSGKVYHMRSSWEVKLAEYLDSLDIRYTYEGLKIPYSYKNNIYNYYPDFYLPDYNIVLEVKPLCYIDADINQIKKASVLSEGYEFRFITQVEFNSLGIELY